MHCLQPFEVAGNKKKQSRAPEGVGERILCFVFKLFLLFYVSEVPPTPTACMCEPCTCLVLMEGIRSPGSGDSCEPPCGVPGLLTAEPAFQTLDFVFLTKINGIECQEDTSSSLICHLIVG